MERTHDGRTERRAPRITALGAVLLLGLLTALTLALAKPAAATHVAPIFTLDNPTCAQLDPGTLELRTPVPSDTTYVSADGLLSVTVDVRDTADGQVFDWTSNIGVDSVFVKGGPNGNFYNYQDTVGEATSDTGLHAPFNAGSGQFFGLSHILFCYDVELVVSKTATTTFTRTFEWDIDKSVTPATWDLFTGDSGTSAYTVDVTKTGFVDSGWAVSGSITIQNPSSAAATITGVSDTISGVGAASVDCGVTFPHVLAAGGTLVCTYNRALPDGTNRTNTATATTSGSVGGGTGTAPVTFGAPTTVVNGTVNVTDTVQGSLGSFSDTGSVLYTRTFACDRDEGTHNNTATIVETGQSDSASVTVNCHVLNVSKDAATSLTRTWTWTIDKSADATDLLLAPGQLHQVNYEVTVDATSVDSGWAVSGNISVHNPAPIAATLNSVADIISPAIAASVNCGVAFPYTLAAGGTLNCTYSASLPDASSRTNTATATLQNFSYSSTLVATPSGTTDFSGSAAVSFAEATITEIDECTDVTDTNVGFLGTVCAGDAPTTFSYSLWFGQHPDADVQLECGDNSHPNTASFVTNDTGATGDDSWTVRAFIACDIGCTLTPGYWKTHSQEGPAPYDDAWLNLGALQEDTIFFLSGQTYFEVLWTAPRGSAYYILAHAYIAAKLNILNGASSTAAVDAAITSAEAFFAAATPSTNLSKPARTALLAAATTLDNYNNGLIGPGHCDE